MASEDGSARRNAIQSDTSLLNDSVYLLKTVHELGSEVKSFRPVRKLSDVRATEAEANPVFGFKRDLVRLIGNLCWRHKKNQDIVSLKSENLFTDLEKVIAPLCHLFLLKLNLKICSIRSVTWMAYRFFWTVPLSTPITRW